MEFKQRLKTLRKDKKLTQGALADILNYGYTAISNYESGRNEPSISDLKKIASFFDVSLDYLLCVNDVQNPYIQEDTKESFEDLKRLFISLNESNKKELLLFMNWLLEKQTGEIQKFNSPVLKVAEEREPYKTKLESNDEI